MDISASYAVVFAEMWASPVVYAWDHNDYNMQEWQSYVVYPYGLDGTDYNKEIRR